MNPHDDLIADAARRHSLQLELVHAIVLVESNGHAFAWRPEPAYRYLWDVRRRAPFRALTANELLSESAPKDFPCFAGHRDQEWWGQQASWGLMQIMGAVARERGFMGSYLPELTVPAVNLEFGCAHLAHLSRRLAATHGVEGVIAAYNTGGPAHEPGSAGDAYVRKVRAAWNG